MGTAFARQLEAELLEAGQLRAELAHELTDILPPDDKFEAVFLRDEDELVQLVEVHSVGTGELRATLTPERNDDGFIETVAITVT